jgi:hypothetical protein
MRAWATQYPAKKQGYVHPLEEEGKEKNEKGEQARSKMKTHPTIGPITLHPHCADLFNLELDSMALHSLLQLVSLPPPSIRPSLLSVDAFCAGVLSM